MIILIPILSEILLKQLTTIVGYDYLAIYMYYIVGVIFYQ